jgi:ABC-type glycerol-3-phosphate transport system substrate-binding protein
MLIYSGSDEFVSNFSLLENEYRNNSGIIIKCVGSAYDNVNNLESYMGSKDPPDIFTIENFDELTQRYQAGDIMDFINASEEDFREITEGIPESLRLGLNDINNCGVPLTYRGFGFVFNPKTIGALFGESRMQSVINDLKKCNFEDFKSFVDSVSSYIENGDGSVSINKSNYPFLTNKTALASNLSSVFLMSAETSYETLMNPALACHFVSASDLKNSQTISNATKSISKFMEMLDMISSKTLLGRGVSFADPEINSQSQALKNFVSGQALFLVADDTVFQGIKKLNPEFSEHLMFLPLKTRVDDEIVFANGIDLGKINSHLTVFCPYYIAINAKTEHSKMAQDFIIWLFTSPVAQKILIENLKFVPYNCNDISSIENSLSRSVMQYVSTSSTLPAIFTGVEEAWKTVINQRILKFYLAKNVWDSEDYKNFANFCARKWNKN